MMSDQVRMHIKAAYDGIRGDNAADWNPVEKVPLCVTRVENQLIIDELLQVDGPDGAGDNGPVLQAAMGLHGHAQALQAVLNQVHQLRQQQVEGTQALQEAIVQLRHWVAGRFTLQANNINRL